MNGWECGLLDAVANHVRFLTVSQLARALFGSQLLSPRQAAKAARELTNSGWLRMSEVLARPVRPLAGPLCRWRHAAPLPDFLTLSRRLHQRASCPAALTVVVSATAKTCTLYGTMRSVPPSLKLTQTTHDLHVAELFLHYVAGGLKSGQRWVGEDALPETWPLRQRPDALLIDGAGELVRAVEYGGDYSPDRLADLHDGLASIPLPYEIW